MRCAVKNCGSNNKNQIKISFFQFPSDPKLLKQWIKFCCREYVKSKTARICMEHFKADDFENKLKYDSGFTKKLYLKHDAVPTIRKVITEEDNFHKQREQRMQKRENKKIVQQLIIDHDAASALLIGATKEMNSNCETFIKQEFLTAGDQLISRIPDDESNILVKNEPISDDVFPAITIKNEPLVEPTCLIDTVSIKTENSLQNQQAISESRDSFVIYELEQTEKTDKEISKEFTCLTPQVQINTIQDTKETFTKMRTSFISNLSPIDGIATKVAGQPPILLNGKLRRKCHRVIIPAKSADKRKRYNIEATSSTLLEKSNNATNFSKEAANTCRLLNSANKKIINHLIKHKQKRIQQNAEENCDAPKSATIVRNTKSQNSEEDCVANYFDQIEQQTATITQAQPATWAATYPTTVPLPVPHDILNTPKQSADSPIIPELRVKCLCSLTGDTSSDNSELREFFQEMFMQTRRLNKMQQRKVKMSLLKAICDAEESVEQGKCCSF